MESTTKRRATTIKPTPWTYMLIRLLFKFVLKVFYSSIVIENEEFIPKNGEPTIICANHGNSLTDALMLITSVSSKKRNFLRMTAKSTLFGQRTFSSWLIENVGSVPVKRRKDNPTGDSDNSLVMTSLVEALEEGDVVCMFPEGMSRFSPAMSPLKSGVARIASDVLTRNAHDPNFQLTLLTCSITYIHPERFRSDVLVTFNPPLQLTPSSHPSLVLSQTNPETKLLTTEAVQSLTRLLQNQLSSGTIDAPSWDVVRISKTATRMYAPLGTRMRLGDWVRVVRTFVGGFSDEHDEPSDVGDSNSEKETARALAKDLKAYQDRLNQLRLKDDRIRRPLSRLNIIRRVIIRSLWLCVLIPLTLPGLTLWIPVFLTAAHFGQKMKKSGPIPDVWDEIAQQKLIYGLLSGFLVWSLCVMVAWPIAPLAAIIVPAWMWMTLRWFEDLMSALRALKALVRMLRTPDATSEDMRRVRGELYERVHAFAVGGLGLPENPERFFGEDDTKTANSLDKVDGVVDPRLKKAWWRRDRKEKGRVGGGWDAVGRYFSVIRRRKRDWNETLKWYDLTEFPTEEETKEA